MSEPPCPLHTSTPCTCPPDLRDLRRLLKKYGNLSLHEALRRIEQLENERKAK